ncbi:glycine oxidase [Allocatelliglobosispora scoriae]|uniref:glycine oxidase n=1 Tax=Allocatelliglobosispora scoriae TaxID=643052 RepID=A0A841BXV0_9ACTN|nr:glycine oxidase ThiO [Allocatelliglobosispora scoriae]MBB5871501.1 glycine oxidase [Allocatelliglobosispora scoriae]
MTGVDVVVLGAGPIGLGIAWQCALRGCSVTVHHDGSLGAWHASAGMIAPVAEATFGESPLTALLVESTRRWPEFAAALGREIGYRECGSLMVGLTGDDHAEIQRSASYQESLGLPVERLSGAGLRSREPMLAPRVRGGAFAGIDAQADPGLLHSALLAACRAAGVRFQDTGAQRLAEVIDRRPAVVVVAAGTGTAALLDLPIHPVRGETLRIRLTEEPLRHMLRYMVRGIVDGRHVYLVPRAGGEIVIGATSSEETLTQPTAGGVHTLLRDAFMLLPELERAAFEGVRVGFRPGTPSNAPYLGELPPRDGVRIVVAAGHYRNGIALTPITATAIAELVTTGRAPAEITAFGPPSADPRGVAE